MPIRFTYFFCWQALMRSGASASTLRSLNVSSQNDITPAALEQNPQVRVQIRIGWS